MPGTMYEERTYIPEVASGPGGPPGGGGITPCTKFRA